MAEAPKIHEFVWNELVSTHPEKCAAFYSKVFGWEPREVVLEGMGVYTIFVKDGQTIAGMLHLNHEDGNENASFWSSYLAVENVDAAAQLVIQSGGTIKLMPVDVEELGRIAIVSDPAGAIFSLITPPK